MKLNRCLDRYFIDFIAYLGGFELGGLRIYDLFKAINRSEVDIDDCYKKIAGLYVILENSLGDPRIALRELGSLIRGSKLSDFIKDYNNILFTSSDTVTYVMSTMRNEFTYIKTKIYEKLKLVELLYESLLVVVLGISILTILPLWSLPPLIGVFVLLLMGFLGYLVSIRVLKETYYVIPDVVLLLDLIYLLLSTMISIHVLNGLVFHVILLTVFHVVTRPIVNSVKFIEDRSMRILSEVYSRTALGETIDVALLNSINHVDSREFKAIYYCLLYGLNTSEVVRRLSLPVFSRRIISLLGFLVNYSSITSNYVAAITQFTDEIINLRKQIGEKARSYILYSIILTTLITVSYIVIRQIPSILGRGIFETLATYVYTSILVSSMPAILLYDRGFTSSKISIYVITYATIVTLTLTTI